MFSRMNKLRSKTTNYITKHDMRDYKGLQGIILDPGTHRAGGDEEGTGVEEVDHGLGTGRDAVGTYIWHLNIKSTLQSILCEVPTRDATNTADILQMHFYRVSLDCGKNIHKCQ